MAIRAHQPTTKHADQHTHELLPPYTLLQEDAMMVLVSYSKKE